MLFLHLHDQGVVVSLIFAGLWLFPFGILVVAVRISSACIGLLAYRRRFYVAALNNCSFIRAAVPKHCVHVFATAVLCGGRDHAMDADPRGAPTHRWYCEMRKPRPAFSLADNRLIPVRLRGVVLVIDLG